MKERVKRAVGRGLFASRLDKWLLRDNAVVVAFHRVHDTRAPEDLTIGVRAFERYCRFFRDHFAVVPLGEIVERLERGRPLGHHLAITFDDGYLDNFENAAPILERFSLPATFFVVTRWIGSAVVPHWDREAGVRHPWMTWTQVRTLYQRGFEIGGHTQTHVDLGAVADGDARAEVAGARADLERELGRRARYFAFPYGGRDNVRDTTARLVRQAGFECCCSCYGGAVTPGSDPFHLPRVPIDDSCPSPHGFGLQVALGRTLLPA
jgi:peptidoglycan/xylan/chitin deacetylase (PgdA/CDA1 family)